jgi:splicing factor 3A subunit 2
MDFQNRAGGKTGGGGVASFSDANADRRERLRQLALETIDLQKDPYFMRNHLGGYECKLCLTLHNNEGSYLAHTQGKKHQANLARRKFFPFTYIAYRVHFKKHHDVSFSTYQKSLEI